MFREMKEDKDRLEMLSPNTNPGATSIEILAEADGAQVEWVGTLFSQDSLVLADKMLDHCTGCKSL